MKKNKLITLILALAVCSSLILSLCSFTTTTDREFDTFEPLGYTVDVHYAYHRVTSTIDDYYYGVIPSFNRTLYEYGGNSPKAFSSNYLMSGTASLDYDNAQFTLVDTDIANSYYTLSSDSPDNTFLMGVIELNGLFKASDVQDYLELIDTVDSYYNFASPDYFYLSGSGYYINDENDVISFTDVVCDNIDITSFNVTGNDYMASINKVIVNWYNSNEQFENGLESIYFTNFKMQFSMIKDFKSIRYRCDLYSSNRRSSHFQSYIDTLGSSIGYDYGYNDGYDVGYDGGYDEGYERGYNKGFYDAPGIWGNLGSFLSTTVGSFLEFEFFNGFTIANVLSLIVSVGVVILFLKIFAGG